MVMEAPPSPDSVGREFVRQYYTLLNKSPAYLHRFYNQSSSFIHGGLDPPNRETICVVGQRQIHQKIQQLNFRDCRTKITQVHSQATLGKGVVVQVTGELSNAGQPMRRFTQTFVLAAQSPKKYYVRNDIFRYLDEIISDEECETENRSEHEEESTAQDCQVLNDVQQMNQGQINYFNPTTTPMQPNMPPVPHHQSPHVMPPPAVPAVNGTVHPDDISVLPTPVPHVNAGQGQVLPTPITPIQPAAIVPPLNTAPLEETPTEDVPIEESQEISFTDTNEPENEQQDLNTEPATSNEPKTYANLLKSGSTVPFNNPPLGSSAPIQPGSVSPPNMGPRGDQGLVTRNNMNRGPRINQQRLQKQELGRGAPGRNSFNEEDDRKRSQGNNFVDQNQLFLGNLPHNATEDELRDIFSEFGSILDLRVHSKPTNKSSLTNVRAPPNYGFITYETQTGVQNCLAAKPIYYPKDDKNGTQLNVEEKKTKDRQSYISTRAASSDNRLRDSGPRRSGPGLGGANRNNATGGSSAPGGIVPNRTNNYNRGGGGGGGPPNRENRKLLQECNLRDRNQVFVGNIPLEATIGQLRAIFSEFDSILDVEILTTNPASRRPAPNCGFITFRSKAGVVKCLAQKDIFYPKNDPNGTRLVVELKKPRERVSNECGRLTITESRWRQTYPCPSVPTPRGANQKTNKGNGRSPKSPKRDGSRRRQGSRFIDRYQIFVGNLPHEATEAELSKIFSEFGQILDLTVYINKPLSEKARPRVPPNYGFVTFKNAAAVQKCLALKTIYYPKNDNNGTKLNIEVKKPREQFHERAPTTTDNNSKRDVCPPPSVPGPSVPGPSVLGPSVPGPSVPPPSVPPPSVPPPSVPPPSVPSPIDESSFPSLGEKRIKPSTGKFQRQTLEIRLSDVIKIKPTGGFSKKKRQKRTGDIPSKKDEHERTGEVSPGKTETAVSPQKTETVVSLGKTETAVCPEKKEAVISPEKTEAVVSSEPSETQLTEGVSSENAEIETPRRAYAENKEIQPIGGVCSRKARRKQKRELSRKIESGQIEDFSPEMEKEKETLNQKPQRVSSKKNASQTTKSKKSGDRKRR